MTRFLRDTPPGSVQHVISRFVQRQFFLAPPGRRAAYLSLVPAALHHTDWRILGYALMSSHIHWCLLAGEAPLANFLRPLHSGFAGLVNRSLGRLGALFASRPGIVSVTSDTAALLLAYIHNNPVRAGLVEYSADSDWTSHRALVGLDPAPEWLEVETALSLAGFDATRSGRSAFDRMVADARMAPRDPALSGEARTALRRGARVMSGGPVEIAEPIYESVASPMVAPVFGAPGGVLRPRWPGEADEVLDRVARETGVSRAVMASRSRTKAVVHARRLAMLVWTCQLGRLQCEMAGALGVGSSSGSRMLTAALREGDLQRCAERIGAACWRRYREGDRIEFRRE